MELDCESLPVRVEITEKTVIVIVLGNDDRCANDVNENECERDEHSEKPFPRSNRGQLVRDTALVSLSLTTKRRAETTARSNGIA